MSKAFLMHAKKNLIPMIKNIIKSQVIAITLEEIAVVFHNGFKYDCHFLIKELVKESEVQFKCLGEKAEKYITFSEPIKKELENNCTQNKFY